MTQREEQILGWIRENPLISQQELAEKAGMDFMNGQNIVTWFSVIFFDRK